jgi:hypothetical protein
LFGSVQEERCEVLAEEEARRHEVKPGDVDGTQQLVEIPVKPVLLSLFSLDVDGLGKIWISFKFGHSILFFIAVVEVFLCLFDSRNDSSF